ncbi:MAG: ABC transporter substrate-binding protein [Chloroflexi bacterium]|nr:ABC transporter substrate-binding protein [Chloroflexota bacterium]
MPTKKLMAVLGALLLLALLLAACGKEEKASPTAAPSTATKAAAPAGTQAPATTAAATAAPTTTGAVKLNGLASQAATTPSRKIAEELLTKYWYTNLAYDFKEKPRYGGIEQWQFSTQTNCNPLDPGAGYTSIPCQINMSQILNHGDNVMSDVLGGQRDNLAHITVLPDLAKTWSWKNDLTFELKLYDNVYWHNIPPVNGRKMTSADVKFTLDKLRTESNAKSFLSPIDSVETPDDTTVVIKLKEVMPALPIHLASAFDRVFTKECYDEKDCLANKGIGTGPFVLKEMNKGVNFKFERFDKYFRKDRFGQQLPYLDGVVILDMPDPSAQVAAYRTGQIDNSSFGVFTYPQFKAVLETNPKSQVVVFPGACGGDTNLMLKLDQKPFDDVRVRRAMSMAINREGMYMTAFQGAAMSDSIIPETFLGYDMAPAWGDWPWKGKEWFQYDPDQAKKLLAEAGYPTGFKTQIIGTFPAACSTMNCRVTFEFVQSELKKVGIEADLTTVQTPEYNAIRYGGQTWQGTFAAISYAGSYEPDAYTYGIYNSKSPANLWGPRPGQDPLLDELTIKQRQTLDEKERQKVWNQVMDRVYDQQYQIELGTVLTFKMYQPWVKNMGDHNCAWRPGHSSHGTEEDWFTEDAPKRTL